MLPNLNAFANHSIIPYDGRDITSSLLIPAMYLAYSIGPSLNKTIKDAAMKTFPSPASQIFNLGDLNKHGVLDYDVSLSHADLAVAGDNHHFDLMVSRDDVIEQYVHL